jgi:phosphate transport system permease protein
MVFAVGAFLLKEALPALRDNKANFFTSREWSPGGENPRFGVPDLLYTTVVSSVIAMLIAVPVAVGIALFLTQYAPKRLATPFAHLIDLLAAVPSVIFGLWGIRTLAPEFRPVEEFMQDHFGWTQIFDEPRGGLPLGSTFFAGVVLAIMILPIVTAVTREVFARTPTAHIEAAQALGATKWETIRTAVLPFGRAGLISAAMLGLGRALGETIALRIILSQQNVNTDFDKSWLAGGETFASKIANNQAEFNEPDQVGAYIAAGLMLFVLTFVVNAIARLIIERRKEFR